MIILFEPECTGSSHEEVNAAILYSFCKANYPEKIIFFADFEHIKCIKEILLKEQNTLTNVNFKPIKVPKTNLLKIRTLFSFFIIIKRLLCFCKENNVKKVVFLSIYSYNLIALKVLLKFFFKDTFQVRIIMHGVLEDITNPIPKLFWKKLKSIRYAIGLLEDINIKYIVLSKNILENLLDEMPKLKPNFCSIEFSYLYKSIFPNIKRDNSKKIFATIGQGNPTIMRDIAAELEKQGTYYYQYELRIIGKNIEDVIPLHRRFLKIFNSFLNIIRLIDNKLILHLEKIPKIYQIIHQPLLNDFKSINCVSKGKWLTRDEIGTFMNDVDYVLFLYEKNTYKLTISGSFFDAISYKKPIIALSNHFFNYIFSLYTPGYLVDNPKEMVQVMIQILNTKEAKNKDDYFSREIEKCQREINIKNEIEKLKF